MHTILNGLNADQRAAVLHNHETGNQLLILAGAGSGKTSVLTKRIQYRIGSGVNPTSILALTFTDLAAREMRERVEKLYPNSGVKLCTFHSLALSLLKEEYPSGKGFELLGFKKAPTPKELSGNDFLCDLAEAGIQAKDISRDELFSDSLSSSVFKKTEICRQKIKETGEVVFEDLIYLAIALIEKFQEARIVLQDKFQEILVDEYQDINPSQYRLVRALLGDRKSLFAVGDDDQAIYGFRGADIGNILRFRKDFQASTLIRLEWNYRSVPQVLYLANRIFVNKPPLLRKVLRAGNRRQDELFLENRIPEFWESDCAREEIR
ncbi:MAG: UvrD-helicase domain-containing protein, partial [Fibrobacteraceae bacterium]|nr:UvrD-helicase domain-containing protein [Fibrobacteraceae bacterium]